MSLELVLCGGVNTSLSSSNLKNLLVNTINANTGYFNNLISPEVLVNTGSFVTLNAGTGRFIDLFAGTGTFTNIISANADIGFVNSITQSSINNISGTGVFNTMICGSGIISTLSSNLVPDGNGNRSLGLPSRYYQNAYIENAFITNLTTSTSLDVQDPIINIGSGNLTDTINEGLVLVTATGMFSGLIRSGSQPVKDYYLFQNVNTQPMVGDNASAYPRANLNLNTINAASGVLNNITTSNAIVNGTLLVGTGIFSNMLASSGTINGQLSVNGPVICTGSGSFNNIIADNALIRNTLTSGTVTCSTGNILNVISNSLTSSNISSSSITSNNSTVNGTLTAGTGIFTNIVTGSLTNSSINVGTGKFITLTAGTGSINTLTVGTGNFQNLSVVGSGSFNIVYGGLAQFTTVRANGVEVKNPTTSTLSVYNDNGDILTNTADTTYQELKMGQGLTGRYFSALYTPSTNEVFFTSASGSYMTLAPSGTTLGGTTIAQSLTINNTLRCSGSGTFTGVVVGSNLIGTNTGNVTISSFGSTPNSSGASLSGQAITIQPCDTTNPGGISTTTQVIPGSKTFATGAFWTNSGLTGYTPSAFNTYETFSSSFSFSGAYSVTQNATLVFTRVGNNITVAWPDTFATAATGTTITTTGIPARFRPSTSVGYIIYGRNNGADSMVNFIITSGGGITVYAVIAGGSYFANFTNANLCGFGASSASFMA